MKLIVGLGNPGRRYRSTPHSVGFEVMDELASRHGLRWSGARRVDAECSEGRIGDAQAMLMKPTTFMNCSGDAVGPVVRGKYIDLEKDFLVVYDDIDLPLGRLRFRPDGSAGGHKGMLSLIERLGSRGFPRLRCGVAPENPDEVGDLADYVLARWPKALRPDVDAMVLRAGDAAEQWLSGADAEEVMNAFNVRQPEKA